MPLLDKCKPVWTGPESKSGNGGVTFSLLNKYLNCKHRFYLYAVEGLTAEDNFNHKLSYGDMWHTCEEAFHGGKNHVQHLVEYTTKLAQRYPHRSAEIAHWANVCRIQFPIYLDYWIKNDEERNIKVESLAEERVFHYPYKLPSGRTVWLRGKMDGVQKVLFGLEQGVYLWENKTKGDINEEKIARQLKFDLQTMLYLCVLQQTIEEYGFIPRDIKGVRYNVIRRPLSGGKGTIRQHKPTKSNPSGETADAFYKRLGEVIREDASSFFMRWTVYIYQSDIKKFKEWCLNPILEGLCDWYRWVSRCVENKQYEGYSDDPFHKYGKGIHYLMPYGLYNPVIEGHHHELDYYIEHGSEIGLGRTDELFPELQEGT